MCVCRIIKGIKDNMITKLNFTDRTIKSYAIRKLTPKECFRLMGVRDNVIAIMQSTVASVMQRMKSVLGKYFPTVRFDRIKNKEDVMLISASQQYKQAGNSIVVDVLAHIYEQLFYPTSKPRKQKQLSLFDDLEDSLPAMPPTAADAAEEKIFLTTFSGYDSQLMAADVLKEWHPDFLWTCKGWSDIDKYACQMHNLVFPQFADCALGDITRIDWHAVKRSLQGREVDLFTYSSPCQDISQAGKQMGLQEGSDTRSALLGEWQMPWRCCAPNISCRRTWRHWLARSSCPTSRSGSTNYPRSATSHVGLALMPRTTVCHRTATVCSVSPCART